LSKKRIIQFQIDEDFERELRKEIAALYGGRKGDLSRAIREALEQWLKEIKRRRY
jgi:Arc/MetJ-type ribon-helix-helix transcriptional regulator